MFWRCDRCDGRTASVGLLHRVADRETVDGLWQTAMAGGRPGVRCPSCERPTAEVPVPLGSGTGHVDVCTSCHFAWFDAAEFESLPPKEAVPPEIPIEERMTAEERRELALLKTRDLADQARVDAGAEPGPEVGWQWLPGLLGMPIQDRPSALARTPLVTWSLVLAMCALSIPAFFIDLDAAVNILGLVPDDWKRLGGLTLLTSFLLHGGVFHLIGNGYFLLIFGRDVEDFLGHGRFLLLVAIAALLGDLTHILAEPDGSVPAVGASGGISGVIAFYALRFPRARLWLFIRVRWIHLPALALFIVWIGIQFVLLVLQLEGQGHVSALAHLGGIFVGFVWWILFKGRA